MDFLLGFAIGLELSLDRRGREAYIMYHGTTLRNALSIIRNGFICSTKGMLGPGVYVTRSFQKAAAYPKPLPLGEEQAILRLRVQVGKVIRIDSQHHPLKKTWHQNGYDTAWVPPNCGMVPTGLEENCVWDPRRIDVLEVLNSDGTTKNLSNFGLMPDPFGYPCPLPVPPMLGYPCLPPGHPMLGFPCPPPGPPMLGFPCPPPGPPMLGFPCPAPGPPMLGFPCPAPGFPSPAFGFPCPGPVPPPFWFP